MQGKYEENLVSGGKLVVTENSWHIQYYFPGPDLRYNGTFVSVDGSRIDEYISAWINNYNQIGVLQSELPEGGSFEAQGEMGMFIHANSNGGYVTIDRWHFSIDNEDKLLQVLKDYTISKKKAEKLMDCVYDMAHIEISNEINSILEPIAKKQDHALTEQYDDNDIAAAYNCLFGLKKAPFTTSKALKTFNGLYDINMLETLKQVGILKYNKRDEDWSFHNILTSEGRKGAIWIINYWLKSCDPQLLEVAELFVLKGKSDMEYIQEKLNLNDERIKCIKKELVDLGILEKNFRLKANYFIHSSNNMYDYIINSCIQLFYSKLKTNQ